MDRSNPSRPTFRTRAAGFGLLTLAAALGFGLGVQGQLSPQGARERNAGAVQMLARSSGEVPNAIPTTYVPGIELRRPTPVAKPRPAARKPKDVASEPPPFIDLATIAPAQEPTATPVEAVDASTVAPADPGVSAWTAPAPDTTEFLTPPAASR